MLKVIAKYASAAAAFGVLMSSSLYVSAATVERAAQIPSVTVRYTDLNLNTSAGIDALYSRLRAAAREVCGVGERRALVEAMASKSCYRETLEAAVADVRSPALSSLHRAENARS